MSNEEKKSDLDTFWDEAYSRDAEKEMKKQMKLEAKQKKKEAKLKLKGKTDDAEDTAEEATAAISEEAKAQAEAAKEEGKEALSEAADQAEEATAVVSDKAEAVSEAKAEAAKEAVSDAKASEGGNVTEPEKAEDGAEKAPSDDDAEDSAPGEEETPKKKKKKKKKKNAEDGENSEDTDDESSEGEEKDGKERDPNYNIVKDLFSLIIYIGIVIIICFLIITFVGQRTTVKGDSMYPTLSNKDNLWIDKLAYRLHDPRRFDIIVFPYDDDEFYIKRIIGLPGETVQIKEGKVYINGEILDDPYGETPMVESGIVSSPVLLKEDQYFVLGDNRNRSHDSRYSDVGFIKRSKITGKAVFRLTPFKKFGKIK